MSDQARINDGMPEYEFGLPDLDDLAPLSQALISSDLASAFNISREPSRSSGEVNRASETTLTSIRNQSDGDYSISESDQGSDLKKIRRTDPIDPIEDEAMENCTEEDESKNNSKRPRLVWTPQLHRRFVDVVTHLGLKNAVPRAIMQLMNVEGLTRENVASHLQKYRLYVKRMQQGDPSPSDSLFESNGGGSNGGNENRMPSPMQYQMMPMVGFHGYQQEAQQHHHHHHHHHHGNQQQQSDGSGGMYNNFPHHVNQNN